MSGGRARAKAAARAGSETGFDGALPDSPRRCQEVASPKSLGRSPAPARARATVNAPERRSSGSCTRGLVMPVRVSRREVPPTSPSTLMLIVTRP